MQMKDYVSKYDSLAAEESLYNIPFRKEFILSQIGFGKRVLDVGCLGGQISKLIMQQNNEVWGVEINVAAAQVAEQRGVLVKVADVEEGLPFESGYFDAINAGEILEHLYDTKAFFLECSRVLRPGGAFIFTTPNLNSLENRIRVLTGGYLSMMGAYPEDHFGEHIRTFNLGKVYELCRQTGFHIDEVRGIPFLQPKGKLIDIPAEWVGRALPRLSKLLMVKARRMADQ